jgi:hypothetical protein
LGNRRAREISRPMRQPESIDRRPCLVGHFTSIAALRVPFDVISRAQLTRHGFVRLSVNVNGQYRLVEPLPGKVPE